MPTERRQATCGLYPKILCCLLALHGGALHPQMQVRVETIRFAPLIESLPLSGSVASPRSSAVAAQESGSVAEIRVEIGDRVVEGEILVVLDSAMARLELDRLEAEADEAQVRHREARRLAEEGRRLVDERNIPRTEYESRLANEAALGARVQQLLAQVRVQNLRLARHEIRAPFDGVIGARLTELGEWLGAGAPALQLVQMEPLRIQARIPERYFPEIPRGTPVWVTLDAYPGERIETRVDSIVPVSDANVRSFIAWMDVPNAESRLAPGMSARLAFQPAAADPRPVLQVPADAIVRRTDGSAIVWLAREGIATDVPVTVGRRSGSAVEIIAEGLAPGEAVVTMGNESLQRGQQIVAVVPEDGS